MSRLVMKFGGTSLADIDCVRRAAGHIVARAAEGYEVVVVVSAMGRETDRLIALSGQAASDPDAEHDLILSSGEQVSAGLLARMLIAQGCAARSFLGWQVPIHTDGCHGAARMTRIETETIAQHLAAHEIVIVAGFQGIGPDGRITVLGRGGSDTSAVGLAAALGAVRCEIYTDVEGVFTSDPNIVDRARRLDRVVYEEMLEMASLGARVLQTRSVGLAMARKVLLKVLPARAAPDRIAAGQVRGTEIGADIEDEQKMDEKANMEPQALEQQKLEQQKISGVTCVSDEAKITLTDLADRPGIAANIFSLLARAAILVDMIVQTSAGDSGQTDITFTVGQGDLARALKLLTAAQSEIGYQSIDSDDDVAKVSVIGIGMRSHVGIAETMFRTLADANINVQAISTSEIKISVLVAGGEMEEAMRRLHAAYGLDG